MVGPNDRQRGNKQLGKAVDVDDRSSMSEPRRVQRLSALPETRTWWQTLRDERMVFLTLLPKTCVSRSHASGPWTVMVTRRNF